MDSEPRLLMLFADAELVAALRENEFHIQVASDCETACAVLAGQEPVALILADGAWPADLLDRVLASASSPGWGEPVPVLVLAAAISPRLLERVEAGLVADVIGRDSPRDYVRLRVRRMLESGCGAGSGEMQLGADSRKRIDHLTGALTRTAMLANLFTETDRVQRMGTPLCFILFDLDDFSHWNGRLGSGACDELLVEVSRRVRTLLRSYDVLGRMDGDEFLAALPGCGTADAVTLAERIRSSVFAEPFRVVGKAVRLSACFAVAASQGRTPVVVLRELDQSLRRARRAGPETIESAGGCPDAAPVEFLSPTTGEDLLAW